jgi:predicted Zn finger-like uncharacterized protein
MTISVTCQRCKATYRVGDALAGKKVRCRSCSGAISVPIEPDEEPYELQPPPMPAAPMPPWSSPTASAQPAQPATPSFPGVTVISQSPPAAAGAWQTPAARPAPRATQPRRMAPVRDYSGMLKTAILVLLLLLFVGAVAGFYGYREWSRPAVQLEVRVIGSPNDRQVQGEVEEVINKQLRAQGWAVRSSSPCKVVVEIKREGQKTYISRQFHTQVQLDDVGWTIEMTEGKNSLFSRRDAYVETADTVFASYKDWGNDPMEKVRMRPYRKIVESMGGLEFPKPPGK